MNYPPIVIFCFKRPHHTARLIASLSSCSEFHKSDVYVFADGPRHEGEKVAVDATRRVIETCGHSALHLRFSKANCGLARSVIDGLNFVFETYDRAVVMEDDLVVSPFFLDYACRALERYQDDKRVFSIAGYGFPTREVLPETYFYRIASSWGWATWRRAWRHFQPDSDILMQEFNRHPSLIKHFDVNGQGRFYHMLKMQHSGRIDSWAVRWAASVLINEGLNLHAGGHGSFVQNNGLDGTGTHCGKTDLYKTELKEGAITTFTDHIAEQPDVVAKIAALYRSQKVSIGRRVVNRVQRLVRESRAE